MSQSIRSTQLLGLVIIALLAFAFGIYFNWTAQPAELKTEVATVLPTPRAIQAFNLTDHNGHAFTPKDLKNRWTLMYFGFTSCPHVCPGIISELNRAYQKVVAMGVSQKPRVAMVSIDPNRDSIEKLKTYMTSFNQDFIGLRGEKDGIEKMTKELGIVYMKVMSPDNDDKNYDIDHSGTLLLFNPQGNLHALFSMPHEADNIAKDMATIINHSSQIYQNLA